MEDELKSILSKKRKEIKEEKQVSQRGLERAEREKERERELERQKSQILRSILSREARERLARIKMAKPEFGKLVENQLIVLSQRGGIDGIISDDRFKKLLKRLNQKMSKEKSESKIEFKRKGPSTR